MVRPGASKRVTQELKTERTRRRAAEEALARSERLFRAIAETALDSIFIKDTARRYTFVNPAMTRLLGCATEDLLGRTPEEVFDPDSARTIAEVDRRSLAGEPVSEERDLLIRGRLFSFHTIQVPMRDADGAIVGVCGIARDVTDRNHAVKALVESEVRFRSIVENVSELIYVTDTEGNVTYISPSSEAILGWTPEEMSGINYRDIVHPEDLVRMKASFEGLLEGTPTDGVEYRMLRKNGDTCWIRVSSRPLYRNGKLVGVQGVLSDITDLKDARDAIRAANEVLLERYNELAQKNTALHEILAHIETEKMEVAKQVTANVDTLIMPTLERIRKKVSPALQSELERVQKDLQDVTSKFGARITTGMTQLSPREVEIANMIRGGLTSKEISASLHVSLRTVETHRNRIRKKLGLSRQDTHLANYLQGLG